MRRELSILALLIFVQGCSFPCEDTVKTELESPDGQHIVTIFERDCGATTDFSTVVSLRPRSSSFSGDTGRIFVAKGRPSIRATWDGPGSLRIECPECWPPEEQRSRDIVFRQESSWRSIKIVYSH